MIQLYEHQNKSLVARANHEIEVMQSNIANPDLKQDEGRIPNLLNELSQCDAVNKRLKDQVAKLKTDLEKARSRPKITLKKPQSAQKSQNEKPVKKSSKTNNNAVDDAEIADLDIKEFQEVLKQVAILEADNIKFSSKRVYIC